MGRKATPGLYKRSQVWHIDKQILGHRLRESTGAITLSEAERYLNKRIQEIREAKTYKVRPNRSFKEAATKYLLENQHKASIKDDADHLSLLCQFIGNLALEQVHIGTLQSFIEARKKAGRKTKTINNALEVVRHILNLAANEWLDENALTWLERAPKIKLLPVHDARKPYALSWEEQKKLFAELPDHLLHMALFKVNTGCREHEVCQLRWEWEVLLPKLNTSVFIIPNYLFNKNQQAKRMVKNGEDRLVVLNKTALEVINQVRGTHSEFVFTYRGNPINKMNNSAWKRARKCVGLSHVRIHDLKHTFGRRLRASGVSYEDRQDLLGHKSERITTHYSPAEIGMLLKAADQASNEQGNSPILTNLNWLQQQDKGEKATPTKSPQ